MNKEEALATKARQELDVLVAQEIFGIETEWDYSPWDIDKKLPKNLFRKGQPRTVLGPMVHSEANLIYPYSTDISAAWQVVEKIRSDSVLLYRFGLRLSEMSVNRARELGTDYVADLMGWLCPEAICKAALLAKLEST